MTAGIETQITRGRTAVWLLHPVAALVLASCFAYGTTIYDSLPEAIATHWGAGGSPDAWDAKSFGSVFFPLMMGAGISAFLSLIAAVVPLMVPPGREATRWELYRREGMIRGTVAAMGGASVLTAVMIGFLTVAGWKNPEHVPIWPALLLTALILGVVLVSYTIASRWARRTALAEGILPTAAEQEEEKLWIVGGLYNNPDDPHIMVPKRAGSGTGLTVNVGNPKGRAAVIVFLVVFVVFPLILGTILALESDRDVDGSREQNSNLLHRQLIDSLEHQGHDIYTATSGQGGMNQTIQLELPLNRNGLTIYAMCAGSDGSATVTLNDEGPFGLACGTDTVQEVTRSLEVQGNRLLVAVEGVPAAATWAVTAAGTPSGR